MLDGLFAIVGTAHVLTEDVDVAAYLEDWTGQYCAPAVAVVRPASTQQVADGCCQTNENSHQIAGAA